MLAGPLLLAGWLVNGGAAAAEVRLAVASNFNQPMRELAAAFETRYGHDLVVSFASSGKHYAQIMSGAPFDVFLAADDILPGKLLAQGKGVRGSRFTYALGRVALWGYRPDLEQAGASLLKRGDFRYLSIANPKLAPYGRAARQVLQHLGLWESLRAKLVLGENVGQAFQFVATGNADFGIVAVSQIQRLNTLEPNYHWQIPPSMHDPIRQDAILLNDTDAAREFWRFLRQTAATDIIGSWGYLLP